MRHLPRTRRQTATEASGRGETAPTSSRGPCACTCTRGATATETAAPFVPGATSLNAVLTRGWKLRCAARRTFRRARQAPLLVRCCSTAPLTFGALTPTVTRLPYSRWELLVEIWSCPTENHVDRRCRDRATWFAPRRTTAPDARWKTTDSARKLLSRSTLTEATALPRPNCAASRDEEKS